MVFFADPDEERTLKKERSGVVQLKLGPRESLDLTISDIIDTVGQAPTERHAHEVLATNPNALMIFVSAEYSLDGKSDDNAILPYIESVFEHLEEKKSKKVGFIQNIKCVIVVFNKVDLLPSPADGVDRRNKIFNYVRPKISRVFGVAVADRSRTMSCSLIEDFDQGKLAKRVAESLGKALAK